MSGITGNNVTTPGPIEVNPKFFLPPNVMSMRYLNNESDSANIVLDAEGNEVLEGSISDETLPVNEGTGSGLMPPESIEIISQTISTDIFGRTLVSVEIEAPVAKNVKTLDRVVTIV